MAVAMDLVRDWEDIQLDDFRQFITTWGFESNVLDQYLHTTLGTKKWSERREEALMTWFNYQRRRIPPQPRRLVSNPRLVCPPEVAQGWAMLQQEIMHGIDLTPRLSRKIENADYNDGLLNDWGFQHFHLGTSADPKHPKLVQGTCMVLLAIVDPLEFYPIDFVKHGAWANRSILEKAISTFPRRFDRYRLNGILGVENTCEDNNRSEMRKCGVNSIISIGDKCYLPPGMGVSTAGTSIAATYALDQCRQQLNQLEKPIRDLFDAQHSSVVIKLVRISPNKCSSCGKLTIQECDYAIMLVNPSSCPPSKGLILTNERTFPDSDDMPSPFLNCSRTDKK